MKIAIVEDKEEDKERVLALLNQYSTCTSEPINIDVYSSGESFLAIGVLKVYNLLLMDIYLADIDGIETVKRFQSMNNDTLVVFLTNSEEDIWRAVKTHGCFDYIRKTVLDYDCLEKVLNDVKNELDLIEKKIVFQTGKQIIKLKEQDIQYVTSRDKYIVVVFENALERQYRFPFSQFYELVKENSCWLLCNRGVLLNMNYIQQTDGMIFMMKNNIRFPIRRKDRKKIIQTFDNYQFERLEKQEIFI